MNDEVAVATPQESAAPDSGVQEHNSGIETGGNERPSLRDSIQSAFDKVDSGQERAEPQEAQAQGERLRNPDGTFAAKEATEGEPSQGEQPATEQLATQTGIQEPPARFSPDAKAAWAQAPEAVRGEINRAISELETGLNGYKEKIAAYEPIDRFMQMAQNSGTTLDKALEAYTNLESLLRQDPAKGLEAVLHNVGLTPQQYAQHVLGQQGEGGEGASQQSAVYERIISDMRNELNSLKQQTQTISQTFEQQQEQALQHMLGEFKQSHSRFDELWPSMEKLLVGEVASDLNEAYEMAERLNPGATPQPAAQAPAAQPEPKPDLSAQTRKGSLSVTGAPSSGSNPANRKPPSSAREALQRRFNDLGISA